MSRAGRYLPYLFGVACAIGAAAVLLPRADESPAEGEDPTVVAAPAQPPAALSADRYWAPIFEDQFTGGAVDATKWNVQDNSNYGSGNNEDQCYKAANTTVADGKLLFTGKRESVTGCGTNPDGGNTYYFTAGMVTTRQQGGSLKFKYRHGYAEVRMRVPRGNIYWPAFWLVGASDGSSPGWPDYGEVDVTEIYGSKPDVSESNFHRSGGNIGARNHNVAAPGTVSTLNVNAPNPLVAGGTNEWHTYGINWTADKLEWFIDGLLVRTYNAATAADLSALGYEHSFILNLAMGGNGPRYADHGYTGQEGAGGYVDGNLNADLPGTMQVDYVKVWQPTNDPPPTTTSSTSSTTTTTTTTLPPPPPPPALAVTAPADGAGLTDLFAEIAGTCATDAGDVTVSVVGPVPATDERALGASCDEGAWATSGSFGDGRYTVTASQTVDESTTTSAPSTFTVDTVVPTVSLDQPEPGAVLEDAPVTLAGRCTTGDGDVAVVLDGLSAPALSAPCEDDAWTLTSDLEDGMYSVTASQTDVAGQSATSEPTGFVVEAHAPTTTDDTATLGGSWRTTDTTVVLTARDGNFPVAQTYFTTDGSTPDESSPTGTEILLTADGEYTIKYFSVDLTGRAEPVRTATYPVRIDRTAPSTTDDTASIGSDWQRSPQTVTLTPSDALSGPVVTYFTTDGSTPTTASSTGTTVALSGTGTYTIRYFSVDAAGNAEPVQTAGTVVRIDPAPPVTTDDTATIGSTWNRTAQTVTLTPSDAGAGSGVAQTYYTTNGTTPTTASATGRTVTLSAAGTYTIRYFSVDAAGNAEAVKTAGTVIRVDPTAPVTTDDTAAIGNAWKRSAQTVTLTPSDATSGVAQTYYTTNGTTPTTASATGRTITLSAAGTYTIRYFSVDAAGNAEAVKTAGTVIRVDPTAPVTTDDTAAIGSAWKRSAQTVTLTPSDATSGVAQTYYSTDGSTPTTASATGRTITLTAPGSYTVRYFSVDAAGNTEAVRTAGTVIRVDTAVPTNTVTFPVDARSYNATSWAAGCSPSSRICGVAADTGSGLASVRVSVRRLSDNRYWSGSTWVTSSTSIAATGTTSWSVPLATSQLANGVSYEVTSWTLDTAGNQSTNTVRTFTYDTSGPSTTASGLVVANRSGNVSTSDSFSVTFNEALNPSSVPASATLTLSRSNGTTSYGISGLTNGLRTTGATGYLTSSGSTRTVTFPGTLTLTNGNRTVTFDVTGGCSGSCSALSTTARSGAFQFVAATALRDLAGNAPSTSSVTASSQTMF